MILSRCATRSDPHVAADNAFALIGEYCNFHSGWKRADARPEFQRLMADAAEREFDCVLVYHTSRFARNQVEARRYKQMLRERLGIKVVSVTQPLGEDHSDPSAFLAESIHEMFDEYYSVVVLDADRPTREGATGLSRRRVAVGMVDAIVSAVSRALRPRTRALAVTWVHSSSGVKTAFA